MNRCHHWFRVILAITSFLPAVEAASIKPASPVVVIAAEPGTYNEPVGASCSEPDGRFFVLWRHEIYDPPTGSYFSNLRGRFVLPGGTQTRERVYSFPLDPQPSTRPEVVGAALARNPELNNWLIYWGHWTQSRVANGGITRVVHATGNPSARKLILPDTDLQRPAMAYNRTSHRFLLAADGVTLHTLNAAGSIVGSPVSTGDNGIYPQVLEDLDSDGFFLFWQRPGGDVMFQEVTSSGVLPLTPRKIATNPADNYPVAIAYNPGRKQFLLLISHGHIAGSENSRVRSVLYDRNFKMLRSARDILIQEGLPAVIPLQGGYAIAYQRYGIVWARMLNQAGMPAGNAVQVGPSTAAGVPSLVFDPLRSKLLVVWLGSGTGLEDVLARLFDVVP